MTVVEWILIILLMIPAVLVCWALFKSGVLQESAARLRVLQPTARHRIWTMLLLATVVGTVLGAAVVWAFSTSHAALGVAVLVGFVAVNGIILPLLQARRIQRRSALAANEAKKSR
jgi:hypothetical protein